MRKVATSTLRLRIGGLTLSVRGPRGVLRPPAPVLPFVVRGGGDIHLDWADEPLPVPARSDLVFESGGAWRVSRFAEGLLYEFLVRGRGRGRVTEAVTIDDPIAHGRLFVSPGRRRRFALTYPVSEVLFHHRMALEGHVVFHGCGVAVGSEVALLCGESGAGKSTFARLWSRLRPGARVLSDDRIVVRRDKDRFRAFGTPWHGLARFGAAASRPLGAIFFMRQSPQTHVRPMPCLEAAGQLFTRTFPPPWLREGVDRTLATCGALATRLPCFDLAFRPDASAVAAVVDTLLTVRRASV